MRDSSFRLLNLLGCGVVLAVYVMIFAPQRGAKVVEDSPGYLEFAEQIANGDLLEKDAREMPFTLLRTPGFPALIAAAKSIIGRQEASTVIAHFLLGLLTLVLGSVLLHRVVPAPLTGAALFYPMYELRGYLPEIMSEWLGLNLLLLFLISSVYYFIHPSAARLAIIACLAGLGPLVRPALIVLLPWPILLALFPQGGSRLRRLVLAVVMSLPLWGWMEFNYQRIGSFTLTTFDGYNLFGVGSLVGSAEMKPEDSEETRNFIETMNQTKYPAIGEEAAFLSNLSYNYHPKYPNHNLYQLAIPYGAQQGLDVVKLNQLLKLYGLRAISAFPSHYLRYIAHGFKLSLIKSWLMFLGLILCVFCFRTRRAVPLAWASLIMCLVHLLHCLLCVAVQVMVFRYFNLTYYPMLASFLLCLMAVVRRGTGEKGQ